MTKKLKKFIVYRVAAVMWLAFVSGLFESAGQRFAGDYSSLIVWGLRLILFVAVWLLGWRAYTGFYRDGDLLIDD